MKFLIPFILLFLAACSAQDSNPSAAGGEASTAAVTITSPAFSQNTAIPVKYTCQGDDISPALDWPAPPAGTKSLALIVDDPDAPVGNWVHWVVYNIPPDSRGLPEGASQAGTSPANLPSGAQQGKNSFNRVNYGGPCPPSGEHHYIFKLYALDTKIAGDSLGKAALIKAMDGHILGQGELTGLYKKQ